MNVNHKQKTEFKIDPNKVIKHDNVEYNFRQLIELYLKSFEHVKYENFVLT